MIKRDNRKAEASRRAEYKCQCVGAACGVNRQYHQITYQFTNHFLGGQTTLAELQSIDRKWRSLGKQAAARSL